MAIEFDRIGFLMRLSNDRGDPLLTIDNNSNVVVSPHLKDPKSAAIAFWEAIGNFSQDEKVDKIQEKIAFISLFKAVNDLLNEGLINYYKIKDKGESFLQALQRSKDIFY